ncbi:matrix-remodeling-associated protein 7 isoform X2 [Rhinatrema bivittatum]|uniref:matrix-remodeling-associated protein 7 isoform X2 n=1 Tax=Rhinatrema bivittatum TaxID=194408 RepID=UPI00112BAD69|nr:matrix-remodeling-associated protein 7 isoform X2 [Rhinatrema bivittatum]
MTLCFETQSSRRSLPPSFQLGLRAEGTKRRGPPADMDGALDLYSLLPLLVTVLALLLASLFVKLRSGGERRGQEPAECREAAAAEEQEESDREQREDGEEGEEKAAEGRREAEVKAPKATEAKEEKAIRGEGGEKPERIPVEESGIGMGGERERARTVQAEKQSPPQAQLAAPSKTTEEDDEEVEVEEEEEESKEETCESESKRIMNTDIANDADEEFSFKYSPGKLRGSQYEKMMTKEELEEEQRVQCEQLAAIFHLMKEKQETFGEMTEGDVKEQLKLYNM